MKVRLKTFVQERYLQSVGSPSEWSVIREDSSLEEQHRQWAEGLSVQSITVSSPSVDRFWIDQAARIQLVTHSVAVMYWTDTEDPEELVGMEP